MRLRPGAAIRLIAGLALGVVIVRGAVASTPGLSGAAVPWRTGSTVGLASGDTTRAALPSTRPERTGYEETSRYADVISFLDSLKLHEPTLDLRSFGVSEQGRRLPLVLFGAAPDWTPAEIRADARIRVLVLANIHAGEVAGKEAALVLARDLTVGRHRDWLDSAIVMIAPIYNADGNERIALRNRPGQFGPLAGMGERPNARGLDLNRDNMKLDAAEARALAGVLNAYDPHVLVDLHTTNGTVHAYHLTYAPPLHPDTDSGIVEELRERWLPRVTDAVRERSGWEFFHYGNIPGTWGMKGEQGWYTFDHRPRFTTNYAGLRNRFGILSEAYSYASFEERIRAHLLFVEELIDYSAAEVSRLRGIVERADHRPVAGTATALSAELARGDTVEILLGEVRETRNPYSGEPMRERLANRRPERMPDYTRFTASRTAIAPAAYLVPSSERETIERLAAHGIETHELGSRGPLAVEVFTADSLQVSEREYQRRKPATLYGSWAVESLQLPAETVVVPVEQRLGRLAVLLLEPMSDDGFASWSVVELNGDKRYPVLRSEQLAEHP
jgi:hypothetical protein